MGPRCAAILRDIAQPAPSENPFTEEYVARLAGGDPAVEEHFSNWFRPLLIVKVRRDYRAREIVEDVAQETLLRVLRNLRKDPGLLEAPQKLGGYVLAVCNFVVLELARSENRYMGMEGTEDARPSRDCSALEMLCSEERRRKVRLIIEELAPRDRDLLRKVFLEERDKDEVCREMKVDRDYLRVVLHRAIQRCKLLCGEG
ncbi:MAG: sigma-70 family RNA polymerase sigma factor [Bryobacter sp.]|jgi:RNA polymerase sigma-70 factor (ECF subfamily)|nr:sigma-70 family RNA polymerase sigma factor [Bryobacter sp.]